MTFALIAGTLFVLPAFVLPGNRWEEYEYVGIFWMGTDS